MLQLLQNCVPGLEKQACSDAGCGGSVVLKIQVLCFTTDHDHNYNGDNYNDDKDDNDNNDDNDSDDIGHN